MPEHSIHRPERRPIRGGGAGNLSARCAAASGRTDDCRATRAGALDATATLGLELEVRGPRTGGAERSLMVTGGLRF